MMQEFTYRHISTISQHSVNRCARCIEKFNFLSSVISLCSGLLAASSAKPVGVKCELIIVLNAESLFATHLLCSGGGFEGFVVAVELTIFIFCYQIFNHTNFGKFLEFFGIFSE